MFCRITPKLVDRSSLVGGGQVISRGAFGGLALYQYAEAQDSVRMLRARYHRESRYTQV